MDDLPLLEDQDLLAGLLHVAEKMGAQEDVHLAGIPDVADEADHPLACDRIEAVGRLVEDEQTGPVHEGLGELGHLLHPQGVGPQLAVAGFSEPHVEQDLVGPFEGGLGRKAGQLAHHAHEGHRGHVRDEGVVLRHVADLGTDLPEVMPDVVAEDLGRAPGHRAKAQQGLDQGGLAGPIGSEQPQGAPGQGGAEILQDLAFAETHTQSSQFNDRLHEIDLLRHPG